MEEKQHHAQHQEGISEEKCADPSITMKASASSLDDIQMASNLNSIKERLVYILQMASRRVETSKTTMDPMDHEEAGRELENSMLSYIKFVSNLKDPSSQERGMFGFTYLAIKSKEMNIKEITKKRIRNTVERILYHISKSNSQYISNEQKETASNLLKNILFEDIIVKTDLRKVYPMKNLMLQRKQMQESPRT